MTQEKKTKKSILELDVSIGKVNLEQKAIFSKHLSVMIKAGLTINEALQVIYDSATGRFKRVLRGLLKSTQAGNSLSDSFANYPKVFSGIFVNATKAGESSGTLEESLQNLADQLEKEKELYSKVKGAMLYPVVVLIAAFILGMAMAFFILPKITFYVQLPLAGMKKVEGSKALG